MRKTPVKHVVDGYEKEDGTRVRKHTKGTGVVKATQKLKSSLVTEPKEYFATHGDIRTYPYLRTYKVRVRKVDSVDLDKNIIYSNYRSHGPEHWHYFVTAEKYGTRSSGGAPNLLDSGGIPIEFDMIKLQKDFKNAKYVEIEVADKTTWRGGDSLYSYNDRVIVPMSTIDIAVQAQKRYLGAPVEKTHARSILTG